MYRVVRPFSDAQDNRYMYNVGDEFPRSGKSVSDSRLEELSSNRNRCGVVFIVNGDAEEGVSEAKEEAVEAETGVDPPVDSEAKRKARKK